MIPIMFPIQKDYDIDEIDCRLSGFAKVPFAIQVFAADGLAPNGYGKVMVDGKAVPRGELVSAAGNPILMIPVGTVVREYGKVYQVKISGFTGKSGIKYPPLSFKLRTQTRQVQDPAFAAEDEEALNAAREGMVLLKNDSNILPLAADSVLNCFGVGQYMYRITATGASLINPRWKPTFMQAVEDHSSFSINRDVSKLYYDLGMTVPTREQLEVAKEKSDTAIIFISRTAGEMRDTRPLKGQYYLSDEETAMIEAVCSVFEKTVAIINTGHPIDMTWTKRFAIKTILYTGYAGMLSSYALMEILDGRSNPSGKLSCTWPWDYYDNPVSKNYIVPDRNDHWGECGKGIRLYYEEDIYLGYRYFDSFSKDVAYCFGHGLSYTVFEKTVNTCTYENQKLRVQVTVTNTGSRPGKEVVRLYVAAPDGKLEKPAHVLAAFGKTRLLAPGESETLALEADAFNFASYDEEGSRYLLEQGTYTAFIGTLDDLTEAGRFHLTEDVPVRQVTCLGAPVEEFPKLSQRKEITLGTKSCVTVAGKEISVPAAYPAYNPEPLPGYSGKTILWPEVQKDPGLLDKFVAQMTLRELCSLNVCAGANWGMGQNGTAGYNPAMPKYKLPSYEVSDANAGLNIVTRNIGFPASSVIASTFNPKIAYTVGKTIGKECVRNGIFLNLGPGMNLQRGILNGRHPEYFSEDPLLTGIMAGHHGMGLEDGGAGCTYKHMFCNNSDTCRKSSQSVVSERALRELYFKAFMYAFGVHKPSGVMNSYNSLNGIYPAENADLIQKLIRQEWGFDGFVMTDWETNETVDIVRMVNAGNCWVTPGGKKLTKQLYAAVKEGKVSRATLENNVRWLLKVILRWSSKTSNF